MIDQEARDLAVNNHSTTFLVEAAAGTGKTTLTIQRILALVESGAKIERIAAVTFTVKAAGELKERLRIELSKHRASPRVAEALNNIDHMAVNTIHGFCSDLLRALPVEAKLEPGFQVTDDLEQSAMRREFWNAWLLEALSQEVPEELDLFLEFGDLTPQKAQHEVKRVSLFDLFETLLKSPVNAIQIGFDGDPREELESARAVFLGLAHDARTATDISDGDEDRLYIALSTCASNCEHIPEQLCTVDAIEWLRNLNTGDLRWIRPNSHRGEEIVENGKATIKAVRDQRDLILGAIFTISLDCVSRWMLPAVSAYRERQRTQGRIGFDDLLRTTRDMLRESHTARRIFKSQFDYLHIDEFQDTDPIQTELLFYLAEVEDEHTLDWRHVSLKPGKLFVVGDPKQSIYRFRGADLHIYNEAKSCIEKSGKVLQIHMNFRSDEKILGEVNEIFTQLMSGERSDAPAYVALSASDENPRSKFAVEILTAREISDKQTAAQTAQSEAEAIAAHIKKTIAREIPLQSRKAPPRSLHFSDLAILLRTGTHLESLTDALRGADIPYVNFMNDAFMARTEIESALTLLSALANPQDTMSVIGALRSPWFGFADDELLLHRYRSGSFVYTTLQPEDSEIGHALGKMKSWHIMQRELAPSALLEFLISESSAPIIYGLKSQGVSRYQNFGRLVELMRRLEQSGETSPLRIVERLRSMTKLADAVDSETLSPADAVRILTIHKAKGLEFPFVYLYRIAPSEKTSSIQVHSDEETFKLAVRSGGTSSNAFEVLKADDVARQAHEENRCLYVAMTRACQRLIVPMGWNDTFPSLAQRYSVVADRLLPINVEQTLAESPEQTIFSPDAPQRSIAAKSSHEQSVASERFENWKVRRVDALQSRSSHTALSTASESDKPVHKKVSGRSAAMRIGTLVHSALENLASESDVAQALKVAGLRELATSEELSATRAILQDGLHEELSLLLRQARRAFRELPFTQFDDEGIREGKIDLLLETSEGKWVLVDYKTDDVNSDAVAMRAQNYETQMKVYSSAVAGIIGRPPDEMWLYFLRPQRIHKLVA